MGTALFCLSSIPALCSHEEPPLGPAHCRPSCSSSQEWSFQGCPTGPATFHVSRSVTCVGGLGSASDLTQLEWNMQIIQVYKNIGDQCLQIPVAPSMKGHQEEKTFFKNKVYFIILILYSKRI